MNSREAALARGDEVLDDERYEAEATSHAEAWEISFSHSDPQGLLAHYRRHCSRDLEHMLPVKVNVRFEPAELQKVFEADEGCGHVGSGD